MIKMNVAIIGYGGMAGYHERKIKSVKEQGYDIDVIGVYDIDPARMEVAREHGLIAYESADALLADKNVDIVLVATPNNFHCEYTVRAANAGKHVISEKPIALNSAEAKMMYDAARKNGVLFEVHQNRRWDRDFVTIKKLYEKKTLGDVYRFESRVMGSNGIPGEWRRKKASGGGMMLDWGVHMIDQALYMVKEKITYIYCRMSYIRGEDCDDGFELNIGFESGLVYRITIGTNTFIPLPRWQVYGTNGTANIQNWDPNEGCRYTLVKERVDKDIKGIEAGNGFTKTMSPRTEKSIEQFTIPLDEPDFIGFYQKFMEAAKGNEEPFVKEHEVMRVMKVMELAFESAKRNEVIKETF